jgi:hypothetical protein
MAVNLPIELSLKTDDDLFGRTDDGAMACSSFYSTTQNAVTYHAEVKQCFKPN